MTDAPKDPSSPNGSDAAGTPPADNAKKPDAKSDNAKPPADPAAADGKKSDPASSAGGYKPEGIADHFVGKDDKETIDKLNNAVLGFRQSLAKKGVPETADGYTLELPDDIKTKVLKLDENGKDPLLEKMKPLLHKHHIPAAAFQELAQEFYGTVAEMAGGMDKNPDGTPLADFEFKALGGAEKAKPQIEGAEVWIKGLQQSKKISEKAAKELQMLTGFSEGLATLMELRAAMGDKTIPKNLTAGSPDGITKEKLDARVQDERYWLKKDPEFIKETTELFQKFYAA